MKALLKTAEVKVIIVLLCLCSLAIPATSVSAGVVISEIMYHPEQLMDEGYEFLELYNSGDVTINLENWEIDGIDFTFGAGASIAPHSYLVLAKDANKFQITYGFAPDYIYNGKLSNSGELLRILNASGIVVEAVAYSTYPPWPVTPDELGPSLERIDLTLNGNTPRNWHASISAAGHTAKAINSVNAAGLPPWITNVSHGTVQAGAPITVTAFVEGATTVNLEYVINFGTPVTIAMLDNGLNGDGDANDGVYGAIIPAQSLNTMIRYRIDVNGPTGYMGFPRDDDSVVYTGTYTEDDASVITGLPIIHWLITPSDYNDAIALYLTDETRPALVYYNGTLYDGVQIRVRGQSSRNFVKKNWKFYFARNHDFFIQGLIEIPVDQFNAQASYVDKTYMRENLAYCLFGDVGHPTSEFFPFRLYKNGQFFGLYSFFEHLDDDYIKRNNLDEDTGALYEATPGDQSDCRYHPLAELPNWYEKHRPLDGDFNDLHDFLNGINNLTGQDRRNFIFDNLDIPRMFNFWAVIVTIHDNDGVGKNYYLYRDTAGTQRWYMLPWDKDLTWGRNWQGTLLNDEIWANIDSISGRTNVSPSHPLFGDQEHEKYDYLWNRLIEILFNEADFRNMYFRRLRTIMDEQLQPQGTPYAERKLEKRIDELTTLLDTEAAMDTSRWFSWGQYQTIAQAAQILKDSYLTPRRTHLFVTHRIAGEIPEAQTPEPPIIISEIMYNPAGDDANEFIELHNPSLTESVDLSNWQLSGVELTITPGTVLLPQSYLVVVKNDVQFRETYGSGHFVAAQYTGELDNSGENLILTDQQGNVIDEVRYDDDTPWPTSPDAGGYSLELIDFNQNNNHVTNWAASASPGGTPGAINSEAGTSPYIPEIKINEVLPVNGSINTDEQSEYEPWIEIYNASPNSVDLGGMFLTDDYNNTIKWEIPPGTILNSGEWMIFWADAEPNDGPLHTNFTLNAAGGSVGFYTTDGIISDYLNYDPLPTDISYGKHPDGATLRREFMMPTPAAENYIVPVPIILNEYNGVADNKYLKGSDSDTFWGRVLGNGGDWFELVITLDHVDIRGWQFVISDDTGGAGQTIKTLTLTNNNLWADLRSGTIITVSENLSDNISNYDPANSKWWINVQAKNGASGTYITASNFSVSNNNWQLTIKDSNGTIIFGPAGEGYKPVSGIGNDEVFKLDENPNSLITERSNYADGSSSTFGAPNIYAGDTKVQDFSELRDIPDTGAPTPDPTVWKIKPTTTGSTSITMIATNASDASGVEYYFGNITDPTHDSGWQESSYYKDKNLLTNTAYSYRIKTRDKSTAQNETAWSVTASAITPTLLSSPPSGTITTNLSSAARTSVTFSHTVAAGNGRLLVVSVMIRGGESVSSITYAGIQLKKAIDSGTPSNGNSGCRIENWYLTAPPVGTANIVVTYASSVDPDGIAVVNFTGVNQSDPIGAISAANATSGTSISINITTRDVNSLIFGAATAYGGDTYPFTPGSGITEMWDNRTGTSTTTDDGLWGGKRSTTTPGVYTFNTTATVSDDWAIAAIEIKAATAISPPSQAGNPSPTNGATNVDVNADLSWTAGAGATLHDVYFGTTSPGTFQGSQTETTFEPGRLNNSTTYYWRIDEKNAGGTTTGQVWNFTTLLRKSLTTSTTAGGTVTAPGIGTYWYNQGTDVNIIASANLNYHFVNWTGTAVTAGKVADPNSAITTVTIDANYTVQANFEIDQRSLTVSSSADGTVMQPGIGQYLYNHGTIVDLNAVPNVGYHFINWTGDTSTIANVNAAVTTITMNNNCTIQANFTFNIYTLNYTAGDGGALTGDTYQAVNHGEDGTAVTAVPDTGYHFVNWSDASTDNPRIDVNVTANIAVTANFAANQYTITASAGANGAVSPTSIVVNYQGIANFNAIPSTGYEVDKWTLDGNDIQTGGNTYTLSNITAGHTVGVTFKIRSLTVTATSDANGTVEPTSVIVNYGDSQDFNAVPSIGYEVYKWTLDGNDAQTGGNTYTLSNITADHAVGVIFKLKTFMLFAFGDNNGSVEPNFVEVGYGASQEFNANPSVGYEVDKWMLDLNDVQTGGNTYILSNVTADHVIDAIFKIKTFTITTSAGANGTVEPNAATVDFGGNQDFNAIPDTGYQVDKWTLDGNDVQTGGNTYTLSNITADHIVGVTFKILTFTVTATADANGTVEPASAVVHYGTSQDFNAIPNIGYEVDKWTLDGNDVQTSGSIYILNNITANHAVGVTFKIRTFTVTATTDANGTVEPSEVLINYGDSQDFNAVPNTGYEVDKWTLDGNDVQTGGNAYTLNNITADHIVGVTFKLKTFVITASAGNNGSVEPTMVAVDYGASQDFNAVHNTGYEVDKWTLDGNDVQTGGNTYTLSNITADHIVGVTFKIRSFTVTATSDVNGTVEPTSVVVNFGASQDFNAVPSIGYEVDKWTLDGNDIQTGGNTYTLSNITADHTVGVIFKLKTFMLFAFGDNNGSVEPNFVEVGYGASQEFNANPSVGYEVDKWMLDLNDVQTGGNTYILNNVTADHVIDVIFKIKTFAVTTSAGANGAVEPNITMADYGESRNFNATPSTGYEVDKWTLDGNDVQTGGNTYSLSNITANHSVGVTFKIKTFTITASAGDNGSVEPTSAVVNYDASQDFNAVPNAGYEVDKWMLDGNDVQTGGNTYTLNNITANHTVGVTFRIVTYTISGNAGTGGVTMNGLPGNPISNSSGNYTGIVNYGFSGTVTPSKVGYTFSPASRIYTDITSNQTDQNYTATSMTYTISGNAGISDVTMKGLPGNPVSDSNGNYTSTVAYDWSGTVTPTKASYAFNPVSRTYTNVISDQTGQDYTSNFLPLAISGYIKNSCNMPIAGVSVDANNGGEKVVTDANGLYMVHVYENWSGTVTPTKKSYIFEPNQMSYVDVLSEYTDQNYAASSIYDINCDGYINWGDMAIIADNWLSAGPQGDFDSNGIVNFFDFAKFGLAW